ncbi:MAG: N-acetyl-gamma-glutamyl-phosphate reductase [Peptococcaceae bacterium]|nr:N-acetyl-gamma-glutamyl-phosphate reductase [Peptococcaceae bacterium]
MIKVGIIGATGYTGAELVRLLSGHKEAQMVGLTSRTYKGEPFWKVYPHLRRYTSLECEELHLAGLIDRVDVIFTALPHGHAMEVAVEVSRRGKVLIDLGADFRLRDARVYEEWYRVEHTAPDLLGQAVYGLPELNRNEIKNAWLIANPGCYPTAAQLALAPLLARDLVEPDSVIIDAKSGVSGAGRKTSLTTHYAETNENFRAYNVGIHRHTPEIEQELGRIAGRDMRVSFTPHLVPMTRGILATVYVKLKKFKDGDELQAIFEDYYQGESFIRVLPAGMLPQTKAVAGSNYCDLGVVADPRTGRAVVLAAIDNLVKGASGQAIQNMNIIFGIKETEGLEHPPVYP